MGLSFGGPGGGPGGTPGNSIRDIVNNINAKTNPGGDDKDVQFNDNGVFGGNDGFQYDKTAFHAALGGDATTPDQTDGTSDGDRWFGNLAFDEQMFNIRETTTDIASSRAGVYQSLKVNPTANALIDFVGGAFRTEMVSSNIKNLRGLYGTKTEVWHRGTGTITDAMALWARLHTQGLGAITTGYVGYFLTDIPLPNGSTYGIGIVDRDALSTGAPGGTALGIGAHHYDYSNVTPASGFRWNLWSNSDRRSKTVYNENLNQLSGPVCISGFTNQVWASLFLRNNNFCHELAGTGTITSNGTTVTGTSTLFGNEVRPGTSLPDTQFPGTFIEVGSYSSGGITYPKQFRQVTAVASNTSLTIQTSFIANLPSGTAFIIKRASVLVEGDGPDVDSDTGAYSFVITAALGRVGINVKYPEEDLHVAGNIRLGGTLLLGATASAGDGGLGIVTDNDEVIVNDGEVVLHY